ncbi:85/88 kDa calcium-independent phospholipase A2-like [Elysia marginata]|uniref:phospholipase A2 n=1 Tax=Elysia marginata TaxID=1093978 RepID=A0AAV4ILY5_9GAST|nr:85/88 kDa calcium-independent phospholipase A2-like [Elysia marginata]
MLTSLISRRLRIFVLKGCRFQRSLVNGGLVSNQIVHAQLKGNHSKRLYSDEADNTSSSEQLQRLVKILQETKTKEEFQEAIQQQFAGQLDAIDEDMAAFLKNLASGFNDIVNAAQAKISPNTVQVTTPEKLIGTSVVKQSGCLTLHRREGAISTLECTVSRPEVSTKMFSLFRYTTVVEAETLFNSFVSTVAPIVSTGLISLQDDVLQSLCDCVREHPLWTSAHIAAYLGHTAVLKCPGILENADRPSGMHQRTPLMVALMGKQAPAIEELLRLGANLSKKDKSGDTAYHYAVLNSCSPIVALLVDYDKEGAINWLNGKGESALLMACQRKMHEATESLLGAGADPRIAAADCLPIHAAVKACDMKSVEAIVKLYPGQANAKDFKYGGTPIHWAENAESIQKLSFFGCSPNMLNNEGNAPLHVMMQKSRRECMMALLCHGADCNIKDAVGETVLHKAIKNDDLELVRQFVVFGADVNLPTNDGQTPRHLASVSKGKSNKSFFGSSKDNRETILYLLHVSGANRCPKTAKGCLKGCVAEGSYNGTPDQTMAALMKLDSVALFDEQLMANVVHSVHSPQSQGAVIDMVDSPMSAGDRVLCLDGGGIKGLVLIQILMEIENAVGRPIKDCFDWIGGTSTGAILALGIAKGISLQYLKGIYVRLKDEVFKGTRPYETAPFEALLRREFGETAVMAEIKKPK